MIRSIAVITMLFHLSAIAQITVNINSGNPACPFPRFQPYANPTDTLDNLATRNPVGVPHAEMEKSIREAYQIMMNRAAKPGGGVGGIDYIHYSSSPDCSEGDGYAMLAAVAMADKTTFDGLWLWVHESAMNGVKRYSDCGTTNRSTGYSNLPGWTNAAGANSAADGDFDIGLALLSAYLQWGEFMGINDDCGNPISYKQAAIDFLKALTDTIVYASTGNSYVSGDVGLDGYVKSGDSWAELTDWAKDTATSGLPKPPQLAGPTPQYADYMAPAYFTQFADFLAGQDSVKYAWNILQFRRAAASSDWLMGQLLNNTRYIPFAGQVSFAESTSTATFTNNNLGEDFRLGWRTILSRVWNGNPASTWDPATHQVQPGVPNTFEQDIGKRYARFLWDARQEPWGSSCTKVANSPADYWGPSVLNMGYTLEGNASISFFYSWTHGTGSPSAVVAQDYGLMAELYRQCEIDYDLETPGDTYLTDVPMYFHGWFRLLGMLVLSGNYPAPSHIGPPANMKIYCDVDKTCAYKGEEVTYTLSYRNYGSVDAEGVFIIDTIPAGLTYVESTGNGTFNQSLRTLTWNIGTVPGFKTETGITPTAGEVTCKVAVSDVTPRQCVNRATITCGNGTGWTSNEYPSAVSATMKRNFVDIIERAPDDSTAGKVVPPVHGGRPGVRFSWSYSGGSAASMMRYVRLRMYNDAQEPYIDIGNYRISFFLYDEKNVCYAGTDGCDSGWAVLNTITEGIDKASLKIVHETLAAGENAGRKWNQRFVIQFSDPLDPERIEHILTINRQLESYFGSNSLIHRGGTNPFRIIVSLHTSAFQPVQWDDDWSWNAEATGDDKSPGYPITPDFTDPAPGNPGVPVDRLNPKHCATVDTTVDNVLVEEWDGYTWRKVFGNAPQAVVAATQRRPAAHNHLSIQSVTASSIRYTLPASGPVRLQKLDMKGRVVATLIDVYCDAGSHSVKWADRRSGANVYLLRLVTAEGSLIKRAVFIK
ncbi:MAG: DUF11 domain-containing protein [Chitinispirillaceae bacterium]|nr:DUF11 domain-containing protein [Chitinispirillaceae bacterium]